MARNYPALRAWQRAVATIELRSHRSSAASGFDAQAAPGAILTRPAIGRHPDTAMLTFVQLANQHTAEIDVPFSPTQWFESDVIPDKGFADIAPDSLPIDFTVASDPALLPAGRIFPHRHTFREPTAVAFEQLRGSLHAQGFMRTVMVVMLKPSRTAALLGR